MHAMPAMVKDYKGGLLIGRAIEMRMVYREFRATVVNSLASQVKDHGYPVDAIHPLRLQRQKILAFREHLVVHGGRMLLEMPEREPLLRMALRIPVDIPMLPARAARLKLFFMLLLPLKPILRRAKHLLQAIGTYHGRKLVFGLQVEPTIVGSHYYSSSLDFAICNLEPTSEPDVLNFMRAVDLGLMKACQRLGVRRMNELDGIAKRRLGRKICGELVLALVEQQVVTTVDALEKLPAQGRVFYEDTNLSSQDVSRFRRIVQMLVGAGVQADCIASLIRLPVKRFDTRRLAATLDLLGMSGAELTELFEIAGEQLVVEPSKRWSFLLNVLNVRSAVDLGRFKTLLESGRTPSEDLALALRSAGAGIDDLECCQRLMLSVGDRDGVPAPLAELQQLLAPPHSLTFAQLALAEDYLLAGRELADFLQVLVKHGYGDAESVLAFQRCYKQLPATSVDAWLCISSGRVAGQAATAVADWVSRAGKGGYIDSFRYLLEAGELTTFTNLQQTIKLAPLGRTLLQYVREDRGISGLPAILKWYYHDARGIRDIRLWSDLDAVARVLLDDAFERKDFTLLEGNLSSIGTVIEQRIVATIGPFPHKANEEGLAAYHQARRQVRVEIGRELAPRLRVLLEEADGVLLHSLLGLIDAPLKQVREKISQFTQELGSLSAGKGPSGATLSDLEADLVAMVYRTTSSNVRSLWAQVTGREKDIAEHIADRSYSMLWRRAEQRLEGQLDSRGLQSLGEAVRFAGRFSERKRKDMSAACHRLSPKRLHDPAADVWSLALHLGVLLGIARGDLNVREWADQGEKLIERMADDSPLAFQQLESLEALFAVHLGDALDEFQANFIAGLADVDAAYLASRLDSRFAPSSSTAKGDIELALAMAREKVLAVFRRWVSQQKRLFSAKYSDGQPTRMHVCVSKSPAAFFAKEAAGLCTRTNTAMWQEERNAHLLVFMPGQKRLAGMALLYFEMVPELDRGRKTLIIRALNPMGDALATHGVSSIVDGYFDVAIRIAQDNGLAAVAFPSHDGMHLMSNHPSIENDIESRFMKRSQTLSRSVGDASIHWRSAPRQVASKFYAYESGQVLVQTLYVIWCSGKEGEVQPRKQVQGALDISAG